MEERDKREWMVRDVRRRGRREEGGPRKVSRTVR